MAKQVISDGGEEKLVREDTAKAFRGTYWALFSVGAFVIIVALMFFGGFLKLASSGQTDLPGAATESQPFR